MVQDNLLEYFSYPLLARYFIINNNNNNNNNNTYYANNCKHLLFWRQK